MNYSKDKDSEVKDKLHETFEKLGLAKTDPLKKSLNALLKALEANVYSPKHSPSYGILSVEGLETVLKSTKYKD